MLQIGPEISTGAKTVFSADPIEVVLLYASDVPATQRVASKRRGLASGIKADRRLH